MLTHPKPLLNVLFLQQEISIYEQLQIEEAMLRLSDENWCILNEGSLEEAIVMGVSSKPHEMVYLEKLDNSQTSISLIQRFSGGGTVIVDANTLFFTLILEKTTLSSEYHNPHTYITWVYEQIKAAFFPHTLLLEENDFTIRDRKVGGNAQCITQKKLLHHTSFLWKWEEKKMNLLRFPAKRPNYRKNRSHSTFCGHLHTFYSSPRMLLDTILKELSSHFEIILKEKNSEEIRSLLKKPHRQALKRIQTHSVIDKEMAFHYMNHSEKEEAAEQIPTTLL